MSEWMVSRASPCCEDHVSKPDNYNQSALPTINIQIRAFAVREDLHLLFVSCVFMNQGTKYEKVPARLCREFLDIK
jgi:hypothetical protein